MIQPIEIISIFDTSIRDKQTDYKKQNTMKTLKEISIELVEKAEIQNPEEKRFFVGDGKKRVSFYNAMKIAKRVAKVGEKGSSIKEVGQPSYRDTVVLSFDGTWIY